MAEELYKMTELELKRVDILNKVEEKRLSVNGDQKPQLFMRSLNYQ